MFYSVEEGKFGKQRLKYLYSKTSTREVNSVSIMIGLVDIFWIRGRVVRELSLGSKGPGFDPPVRSSVVKIANHC